MVGPIPRPILERLLARIAIDGQSGCWLWTGAVQGQGYGRIDQLLVHRVTYEHLVGPIPEGLQLDHLCRVRRCCNPEHLEAVTPRENVLRGEGVTAVNAAKTACPRGHEYDGMDRGGRRCLACHRERERARRAERAGGRG